MRLGLGAGALLLLFSGVTVRHAPAQDGSICALLEDDRKRLDCYDLLFKKPQAEKSKPAAPAKPQTAGTGKWQVEEFISKLDDSTNVVVTVSALEPFRDTYESYLAALSVACREGETNVWINFQTTMTGGQLVYRVDRNPARRLEVRHSTDYKALGVWEHGDAIAFAEQLLTADLLLVRAIPYGEEPVDTEFPVSGLAEAIKPLRKACNW
jgi:type VI secretion system protein VasI